MKKQIKLESESLIELKEYEQRATQEIADIIDFINKLNPNSINKDKALDKSKWNMEKTSPKSRRGSPSINVGANKSKQETASLLLYLKSKLSDCNGNTDDEKKAIKLAKGRVDLLGLQAASKIAEVAATDYLTKVQNNSEEALKNHPQGYKFKHKIDNHMEVLKGRVQEFSLDFAANGFKEYTSAEVGKHRAETLKEFDKAIAGMQGLAKRQGIDTSEMISNLKDSKEIFKNKSAINFDVPTKGTTKKNARMGATFLCSLGSLLTGVAATGVLIGTAGAGLPISVLLGGTSAALGASALSMTAVNSAENFLRYRVSPSTSEKVSMAVGATALGFGVAGATGVTSAIGTGAAVIGKCTSQAFTTSKNCFAATTLIKASTVDRAAQQKLKRALNEGRARSEERVMDDDNVMDNSEHRRAASM